MTYHIIASACFRFIRCRIRGQNSGSPVVLGLPETWLTTKDDDSAVVR